MTLVDADLRSGSRLETGRRSESIIFNNGFDSKQHPMKTSIT